MDLPFRIVSEPPRERVICVDGALGAPGLELSHWPGNRTPRELRHDLSTGAALAFARLSASRRGELAQACVAVVNNHYDTDGVCAAFAVLRPEAALARERALLDAAAAGDLFRVPSESAFVVDAIVAGFADPERSPIADELAGLPDSARHERCVHELLERLPAILDGEVEPYAALWRDPLEALRADLEDLAAAARDEIAHLELTVWTAPTGRVSSRNGARAFDPGRHALFGSTRTDRALAVGPQGEGATYRAIVNTSSWFDLASGAGPRRPDLRALARRLDSLEPPRADREERWRSQEVTNAAPELWFGREQETRFAEHSGVLAASALPPAIVRRELIEALRAAWEFPD